MKNTISLGSGTLTLIELKKLSDGLRPKFGSREAARVKKSRKIVDSLSESDKAYYGVNTGFGYLANIKIEASERKDLQENIVKSHAGGYGPAFSVAETKAAMGLRLNAFLKGRSGVSLELCKAILNLLTRDITPVVPEYGSVGASGDLIPLAHAALPLIGKGSVVFRGRIVPARSALSKSRLKPITLKEKEGLALVNGTEFMQAVGGLALWQALTLQECAEKIVALSFEALGARPSVLDPKLMRAKNQNGPVISAKLIRGELLGSILYSKNYHFDRVQDPYSLRCAPQVHGACRDSLGFARSIVENELNAITDNPLVFAESSEICSGGNFHGESIAMALDFAAMACSELSNISERRLELLCNPRFSGLSPFLTATPGVNSGYMVLQYLAASLVNSNKLLSNPSSTDSIPGNIGIEDHVSMGMTSARKLRQIVDNLRAVLACELLAACQAIDLRGNPPLGQGTLVTYSLTRKAIKPLQNDRIVSDDVAGAVAVIKKVQQQCKI